MRGVRVLFLCLVIMTTLLQPVLAIDDYGEDEDYLGQVVDDYLDESNTQAKNNVIRNATLDCMELEYGNVSKTYQNFTAWTESDIPGRLSQTDTRSSFTNLQRSDDETFLWRDFGVGYFSDFTHEFDLRLTAITQTARVWRASAYTIATEKGDFVFLRDNDHEAISLHIDNPNQANKFYIEIRELKDGANWATSFDTILDTGVTYYMRVIKDGTNLTVSIYDNSARTSLIESETQILQVDYTYQYLMCPQSLDYSFADAVTGYIEYLVLDPYGVGYENGHYYTVDMLGGDRGLVLMYNVTIPEGTGMTMEFSSDNVTWVDHNNAPGYDTLINGFESLDLRDLSFTALYIRVNMTSLGENTPRIYQLRLVTITDVALENVTGTWVDYNFTSIVTLIGNNTGGNYVNATYWKDSYFYTVNEVTGAPGYDIRFNVTGLPDNSICLCLDLFMYYDGSGGHTFQIEVWNFTDSNWDFVEDIPDECCRWFNNTLECVPDDYVQNGTLMGRFYHPSPGNVNHVWGIDYGKLRAYVPYEEVPALSAMGKYYALAIILLILGVLLGLGMRRRRR